MPNAEAPAHRGTIVAGTDGSESAERAVREAARLAAATGARLVLVSAFSDLHPFRERLESSAREQLIDLEKVAEQLLLRAAANIGVELEVETVSRQGHPAEVIADVAREEGAQLIVVGDRGLTGIRRFLLGSVSERLSHHAQCNVLIVRGDAAQPFPTQVVAGVGAQDPFVPSMTLVSGASKTAEQRDPTMSVATSGSSLYQFRAPFVVDSSQFERAFGRFDATAHLDAIEQTVQWFRSRGG